MKYTLQPVNKYIVIETLDDGDKVGSLYLPGNTSNQYRMAKVVAVSDCDECKYLEVGDTILYDTLGAVSHRVGNSSIQTVKALNVLGKVNQVEE